MITITPGFGMDVKAVKNVFFDRPAVMNAMERATFRVFSRFGAFVRRTARKSLRKPRQKRIGELTRKERQRFRIQQRLYKAGKRRRKPRRPLAPSEPGKPPRNRTDVLKKFIYFSFDKTRQSVVIGPAAMGPRTADVLEYGGTVTITTGPNRGKRKHVAARPFMWPAYEEEEPKLDAMWRDSIR